MGIRTENLIDRIKLLGNRRLGRRIIRQERKVYIEEIKEDKILHKKLPEAVQAGNITRVKKAFEDDINISKREIQQLLRAIKDMLVINFRQIKDLEKIERTLSSPEIANSFNKPEQRVAIQNEITTIRADIKKFNQDFNNKSQLVQRLKSEGTALLKIGEFFNISREGIQIARNARRIISRVERLEKKVKNEALKAMREKRDDDLIKEISLFSSYKKHLEKEEELFTAEWIDTITLMQKKLEEFNPELVNLIKELINGQGFSRKVGEEIMHNIDKRIATVQDDLNGLFREIVQLSRSSDIV